MPRSVPILAVALVAVFVLIANGADPVVVRPADELAEDRFQIAVRAKEEMQEKFAAGLVGTSELLQADERALQAFLESCPRSADRARGLEYHRDRVKALYDHARRQADLKGETTAEFLDAAYALADAEYRLAQAAGGKPSAELAQARIAAARQGFDATVRNVASGKAPAARALDWSAAWLNAEREAASPAQQGAALQAHQARIAAVESAVRMAPPPRGRPPVIDVAREIAYRRAEADVGSSDPAVQRAARQQRLTLATAGRDLLLKAVEADRVGIEPVLVWLQRALDAQAAGSSDRKPLLEAHVRQLRALETTTRQNLNAGSRYIAEADLTILAYHRLTAEHALAAARRT